MAANLDELGERLGACSLQTEMETLQAKLGVLETLADREQLEAIAERLQGEQSPPNPSSHLSHPLPPARLYSIHLLPAGI